MRANNSKAPLHRKASSGYSMVEVLVALSLLSVGVIAVVQFFPVGLRNSSTASLRGQAALLAQLKVEELRRDERRSGEIIDAIAALPAPTDLTPFPQDDRLAYQFHSRSQLSPNQDQFNEIYDDFGVARVIVRYNPEFRPDTEILYELRFDKGF